MTINYCKVCQRNLPDLITVTPGTTCRKENQERKLPYCSDCDRKFREFIVLFGRLVENILDYYRYLDYIYNNKEEGNG